MPITYHKSSRQHKQRYQYALKRHSLPYVHKLMFNKIYIQTYEYNSAQASCIYHESLIPSGSIQACIYSSKQLQCSPPHSIHSESQKPEYPAKCSMGKLQLLYTPLAITPIILRSLFSSCTFQATSKQGSIPNVTPGLFPGELLTRLRSTHIVSSLLPILSSSFSHLAMSIEVFDMVDHSLVVGSQLACTPSFSAPPN